MASLVGKRSVRAKTRQSPALEFPGLSNDGWIKEKTIVITGGASGLGEGFVRRWAAAGAHIVFGDINIKKGQEICEDVRRGTGNEFIHFIHCDVTDWQSQVKFFQEAVKLSPTGGIDSVVANAGVADSKMEFERPKDLDKECPPPPNLDCLNVNLTGLVYTSHLALFYLPRNPGSSPASHKCDHEKTDRDRHLLLIGSLASFMPIVGQALYGASKHAVLGLYRCLRGTSFVHGVRVNLICPYWVDTPILSARAKMLLAGTRMGSPGDVVEAATRFASDPRIVGRAVFVGPKLRVIEDEDGEWTLAANETADEQAIWELHPRDFEDSDTFTRRILSVMESVVEARGWAGWASDLLGAGKHVLSTWWKS